MKPVFLICKSSAGSGKTYTLVKEYLKIVLNNPADFSKVLAITFTNKAADEMRQRILTRLKDLASGKDYPLKQTLIKEGVKTKIEESAGIVLDNILHHYSWFSVSTIDSFFNRIIRSFARELKLHPGYEIFLDEQAALEKASDDVLADIGTDAELTRYLEEFVYHNIEEDKGWAIDRQIKDISFEIIRERYRELIPEQNSGEKGKIKEIISMMFSITNSFESRMKEISTDAEALLKKHGLIPDDFNGKARGFIGYFSKISGENDYKKDYLPSDTVRKVLSGEKNWFTATSGKKTAVETCVSAGLKELLNEAVTLFDSHCRDYYTAKIVLKTIYILGIFKDVSRKLNDYRDDNKVMLISDMNYLLHSLMKDNPVPFVYEKTGSHYKHFLIDEFQDTSVFQWSNVLPLLINSLSEGYFSMIVGDVKQSIYRWRNGDMKLLLYKAKDDLGFIKDRISEQTLTCNRRSKKEIINFNNNFFSEAIKIQPYEKNIFSKMITETFDNHIQDNTDADEGGYAEIKFFEYKIDSEQSTYDRADEELLRIIEELENDNFPLKSITVLVRKNDEGRRAAGVLMKAGKRVVSNESLLVINSPKVRFLVSLIKWLNNKNDSIAQTEALFHYNNIYAAKAGKEEIFTDYRKVTDSLFSKFIESKITSAVEGFSLYELVEYVLHKLKLFNEPDAYLLKFLDTVLEFSNRQSSSPGDFMDWWEEKKSKVSIVVPEQEDAIKIMTIHKSKGLQNNVVVIPYLNWEMGVRSDNFIWARTDKKPFSSSAFYVRTEKLLNESHFSEDMQTEEIMSFIDNLNLLYVAFTRPTDRLYILVPGRMQNRFTAEEITGTIIKSTERFRNNFDDETNTFSYGKKIHYKETTCEYDSETVQFEFSHQRFITEFPDDRPFSLRNKQTYSENIEYGILFHKILSKITTRNEFEKEYENVIRKMNMDNRVSQKLKNEILKIINNPQCSEWFAEESGIKTEQEIILPDGEVLRPDRIIFREDKTIVIDFKTGKYHDSHKSQVSRYAEAMIKAGLKNVNKYLYYIGREEVIKF